jgi:thiol-disulfide isomerase/thioredoxin
MDITDFYKESENIKELKYKNFKKKSTKLILKDKSKSNKIIIFYLSSCKYCKDIITLWDDLSHRFNYDFTFYAINCDDINNDNDLLCTTFKIKTYPHIKYILSNNNKIHIYNGLLNRDDLFYFFCKYI